MTEKSSNIIERREKWNQLARKKVSECVHSALMRVCGGGYSNNLQSSTNQDKVDWENSMQELAFSSVSFPNKNVSLPFDETVDYDSSNKDDQNWKTNDRIDGKPHDIEIRAALKFFHRYKSKKRRRNQSKALIDKADYENDYKFEIISDMGLTRAINSSQQLAHLLCLALEDDLREETKYVKRDQLVEEVGENDIEVICSDVRPDKSGLICLVTQWRGLVLRRSGRLPCPLCTKWCKGEKGLWWHQQMEHGNTHSSAFALAVSQKNHLAIVLYNENKRNHFLPKLNLNFSTEPKQKYVEDAFEYARKGDLHEFKNFIEKGFFPSSHDKNGATPLHWAAGSGHLHIVQYLVDTCQCIPDEPQKGKRSFRGRTPLHWAARNGHFDVVRYLVEIIGVNIDATTVDGTTAFCWACWQGHIDVMRYLHMKGCDIHKVNKFGCNAVLWTAQGKGNVEIMKWLHSLKCDFKLINNNGHGVLHKAAQRGNIDIFEHLCSSTVEQDDLHIFGPDGEGCCPSDLAGMEGHEKFAIVIADKERSIAIMCFNTWSLEELEQSSRHGNKSREIYPKWLAERVKYMRSSHVSYIAKEDNLWEANGGIGRMACTIIKSVEKKPTDCEL